MTSKFVPLFAAIRTTSDKSGARIRPLPPRCIGGCLHGVRVADIPFLSQHAMHDPCILTNPRESSQRDVEVVYGEAL